MRRRDARGKAFDALNCECVDCSDAKGEKRLLSKGGLSQFFQVETLSRARLDGLVSAKPAHIPSAFVWKISMSVWAALNRRFGIPQYRLLPESRMDEAVAFLSALEIGPGGNVIPEDRQLALPVNDICQVRAALAELIAQAQTLLEIGTEVQA